MTDRPLPIRLAVALLALLVAVPPGAVAQAAEAGASPRLSPFREGLRGERLAEEMGRLGGDPTRILLRDWAFDPLTERLPRLSALLEPGTARTAYRVVQFLGPVDGAVRDALRAGEAAGVLRIAHYVPNNAFVVRVEGPAGEQALAALPNLRWSGPWSPAFKVAGELARLDFELPEETTLNIDLFPGEEVDRILRQVKSSDKQIRVTHVMGRESRGRIRATLPTANLPQALANLASIEGVATVDRWVAPELLNNASIWVVQNYDTVNTTNYALSATIWNHGLTGTGQIVAVCDSGLDSDMCFFKYAAGGTTDSQSLVPPATGTIDAAKKVIAYYVIPGAAAYDESASAYHGTHVAGSVAGDNFATLSTPTAGGHDSGDGMAPNAKIVFQDVGSSTGLSGLAGDLTNMFTQARNAGARIHTNSWGADVPVYTADALDMDEFMWRNEDMIFLVAMGNSGSSPGDGSIGAPATAKGIVSVGATVHGTSSNASNMTTYSRGPVSDGRRKPDVVTPGSGIVSASGTASHTDNNCSTKSMSGTSMATPTTAGSLALLRQYYVDGWYPSGAKVAADSRTPSGALMKATLVNGALPLTGTDPLGGAAVSKIPSMDQGYGRTHLENALFFSGDTLRQRVWDVRNADGLTTGQTHTYTVTIGAGQPLRVSLAWTDPEAATSTGLHLVNNLDLEVEGPGAGTIYKGNVYTNGFSTTGGTADNLNPVEQVWIQAPGAGTYTVRVKGTNVPGTWTAPGSDRQGYGLVASFASAGCTPAATVAPTGLTATDNGATGVQLSWNAAAGATGYNVYKVLGNCGTPGASFALLGTTTGTSYLDTKANGGNACAYVVRPIDGCSEGPASACATATYTGNCAIDPVFAGATGAVNNPLPAACRITVSWGSSTSSCLTAPTVKYNVYRGTNPVFVPAPANRVATGLSGTSWDDTTVSSGTTYYYVVRAEDSTTANGGPANGGNEDNNANRQRATALSSASAGTGTWTDDGGDSIAALLAEYPWRVTAADNHTPGGAYCYRSSRDGWNYEPGLCSSIRTPDLKLVSGQPHSLTFWARYNFEYQWDGLVVEISSDGGANWTDLGSVMTPTYPTTLSQTQGNGCNFATSKSAFTGPNGNGAPTAWTQYTANLATWDNQTVRVRWRYAADNGLEFEGFYLDDLSITNVEKPAGCAPHLALQSTSWTDDCGAGGAGDGNGFVDPGEVITLSAVALNDGNSTETAVSGTLAALTPGVTILDGSASLPNIALGGTGASAAPHLQFLLSPAAACSGDLDFDLQLASSGGSWTYPVSIPVGNQSPVVTTLLSENFEGATFPPSGWSVVDGSTGGGAAATWTSANPGARTITAPLAGKVAIVDSDNAGSSVTQDEQLITPVLDCTGATAVTVEFDHQFRQYGAEKCDVDVRSSLTGGNWVNAARYTNTSDGYTTPVHKTVTITSQAAGASNVEVRFRYYDAQYEWWWMIDNVSVKKSSPALGCVTCPAASGPKPVPDGDTVPGTAMRGYENGANVRVTWASGSCLSSDYNVYWGSLGAFGAFTGGSCAVGTSGDVASVGVPADAWWIITGTSGSEVASFGKDSSNAERTVTGWGAGGTCPSQSTKNVLGSCP